MNMIHQWEVDLYLQSCINNGDDESLDYDLPWSLQARHEAKKDLLHFKLEAERLGIGLMNDTQWPADLWTARQCNWHPFIERYPGDKGEVLTALAHSMGERYLYEEDGEIKIG
jgi:hypothetical protein